MPHVAVLEEQSDQPRRVGAGQADLPWDGQGEALSRPADQNLAGCDRHLIARGGRRARRQARDLVASEFMRSRGGGGGRAEGVAYHAWTAREHLWLEPGWTRRATRGWPRNSRPFIR